ncbi:TPA: radical SAM protein [Candidatus Dojkabacteria bacterium]|uniref:Radical SAM protein n=1 Tax=Candidatus Dojkabacteria bacterium TaxID=2099670 RepID=A0A832R8G5_9BACT|nr:radical SAM protein [Candidatus Dojkabacteria bacterium]
MNYDVIVDCYTDEPSGLGVPPFLSVHSRYIAGTLEDNKRKYYYLTIDDLRFNAGETHDVASYNKRILNVTKNKNDVRNILANAENIYIVMGCFVKYEYVSAEPPSFVEVEELMKEYNCNKLLFYSLGGNELTRENIRKTVPQGLFSDIIFGNTYNYFIGEKNNKFTPNYDRLRTIAISSSSILNQLSRPLVIEVETAIGCNRKPGCTFCIEGMRGLPLQFREIEDIVAEIKSLYDKGALYFRLGRQPNFYAYKNCNPNAIEKLFQRIWEECPNIKTLHIDNVSPHNVNTLEGVKITEIIAKYTTAGNIAPFGVESFDPKIRELCNLNGSLDDIHESINMINKYGKERGENGLPKLLPGINIIYGLDGQSNKTLDYNLTNFRKMLDSGSWVRRVFVRKLTSPYGEQFDKYTKDKLEEFEYWNCKIRKEFTIPMLKKVFPVGLVIKDLRMEMFRNGDSILRQMATCPVRVVIKNTELKLDDFYNVRIIGYIGDRTLLGEVL